ncbi:MAG: FxLYD domain-containing protein [Cyanobacteria bacterium P01_D01_bin.156]
MGRDQIIEDYIQRLLSWEEPVTAAALTSLAEEAGLGPDDMAAVEQKAKDHSDRGRNYLDFDCLDEAIEELTQATALDPLNFESLRDLAYAYDQRYGKQKKEADKKQAIALAKRCLDLHPKHAESVVLISSLEHGVDSRQRYLWLGGAIVLLALVSIPAVDFFNERSRAQRLAQEALNNRSDSLVEASTLETSAEPDASVAAADIPITLNQAEVSLRLEPRQSRLDNYDDASYYTLQAVLQNTGNQEIEAVQLNIDYLDQAGNAIATDSKDAIADNQAIVRPGDSHAFDLIQKTTPDLASVSLNVLTVDQVPAPSSYAPGTPIPYKWGFQQPAQLTFDLRARSENLKVYDITDSAYFDAEWAFTNTSDVAIRRLKLQVNFYNASGKLILSEDVLAVYGSDAPMLPKEVRPVRVISSIDKDYARYEVKVLEAE